MKTYDVDFPFHWVEYHLDGKEIVVDRFQVRYCHEQYDYSGGALSSWRTYPEVQKGDDPRSVKWYDDPGEEGDTLEDLLEYAKQEVERSLIREGTA